MVRDFNQLSTDQPATAQLKYIDSELRFVELGVDYLTCHVAAVEAEIACLLMRAQVALEGVDQISHSA